MKNRLSRWTFSILISSAFLVAAGALSLCIGSAGIPITKIISILLDGRGTSEYSILVDIRLPRIILGFAIGGALSLAGVILQGMFRNPLVEPYTLGISGGAALGTSICIILKLNRLIPDIAMPLSGFIGALLVILLVYFINTRRGIFMIQGLLLTGVMISFI